MSQEIITVIIVGISVVIAVVGIVRRFRRRGDDGCDCDCGCDSTCPLIDKCGKTAGRVAPAKDAENSAKNKKRKK